MTALYYLLIFLFLFVSIILCLVILVQESKSSGLGASFGGDSGDSLLGASAPEILKKVTGWLAVVFLGGCILLSVWTGALGRIKESRQAQSEMVEK